TPTWCRIQLEYAGLDWTISPGDTPDSLGKMDFAGRIWCFGWSRRQESNLYLPLRRRPFYPLNYGELGALGPGAQCKGSAAAASGASKRDRFRAAARQPGRRG